MAAIVVEKQWNGHPTGTRPTVITFSLEKSGDISILIDAPFHDDPAPPAPAGKFGELYNYECVEVFFAIGDDGLPANSKGPEFTDYSSTQYLEVGLGPHGHWYATMFVGQANFATCDRELEFKPPTVVINAAENCWNGEIRIPVTFVPEPDFIPETKSLKWMINAFAVHGTGASSSDGGGREYLALSAVPGDAPNFHQLAYFVPLLLTDGATANLNDIRLSSPTAFKLPTTEALAAANASGRGGGRLSLGNVNLDDADGSEVSSDAGADEDDDDEEQAEARLAYRMLSGIVEETESDMSVHSFAAMKLGAGKASASASASASSGTVFGFPNRSNVPGSSGSSSSHKASSAAAAAAASASATAVRAEITTPVKDWYNMGRESIDSLAPQTLAAFTEQFRGSVILDKRYGRYMNDDEFALICAKLWKRKGWSYKERVLILTSKPRLLYLDEFGKYKGTIPWTTNEQIHAAKVSASHFDIATGVSNRLYHFNDKANGSEKWVKMINDVVDVWTKYITYEKEKQTLMRNNSAGRDGSAAAGAGSSGGRTPMSNSRSYTGSSGGHNATTAEEAGTPLNRNRTNSSTGGSGGVGGSPNATPNNSGTSISNVPLTVNEVVEKYRPGEPTALMGPSLDSSLRLANEAAFNKFIHPDEYIILMGAVNKAQGFLPKKRVLILTSKPRLLYLKRDGTFVGTVAWSMTTPLIVKQTSPTGFDVTESVGKTTYHFSDPKGGSTRWVTVLKEIGDAWQSYLKWQVGKVKAITPQQQAHTRK